MPTPVDRTSHIILHQIHNVWKNELKCKQITIYSITHDIFIDYNTQDIGILHFLFSVFLVAYILNKQLIMTYSIIEHIKLEESKHEFI